MTTLTEMWSDSLTRCDMAAIDAAWDNLWSVRPDKARIDLAHAEIDRVPLSLPHELMLTAGHHKHQEVANCIQGRANPASLPTVKKVLDQGFDQFAYTCSEDAVIAKWFSHILGNIGTPDAIQLLKTYAESANDGIATEMKYRLKCLKDKDYDRPFSP